MDYLDGENPNNCYRGRLICNYFFFGLALQYCEDNVTANMTLYEF